MISAAPMKPGCGPSRAAGTPRTLPRRPRTPSRTRRAGIIGHRDEPPALARDPDRLEDAARHELARRVLGRHQVVEQLHHHRLLQLRVQEVEQVGRVLDEPAEAVAAPVAALEREHARLLPAHAPHGPQAARLGREVQHLDAHGRHPQVTVAAPPDQALRRARRVVADGHGAPLGLRRGRSLRQRGNAGHEREADGDDGEPPGARTPGHGSGNGDVLLLHDEPPASNLCPGPCGHTGASDGDGLVHVRGQSTRRAMPEAQQTWQFTRVCASAASAIVANSRRSRRSLCGRQRVTARATWRHRRDACATPAPSSVTVGTASLSV